MDKSFDTHAILCPSCGLGELDLLDYVSLMVIRQGLGLFTVSCPHCKSKISSIQTIPASLTNEVELAAKKVGAGMGLADQDSA